MWSSRKRTAFAILTVACISCGALASCSSDEASGPAPSGGGDASNDVPVVVEDGGGGGDTSTPSGPITIDEAVRAAVVLGSCIPGGDVHRHLAAIYYQRSGDTQATSLYRDAVKCLATSNNGCAALKQCTGVEADLVTGPNDCVEGCTGTLKTSCHDQVRIRQDCARTSDICVEREASTPVCVPAGLPGCPRDDAGKYTPRCEQGKPSFCVANYEALGPDCASLGLACGATGCAGTEGACTSDDTNRVRISYEQGISCDGTEKLKACINDGISTVTCSNVMPSFTCQTQAVEGGTTAYCGLGTQCTEPDRHDLACNGDSVVVCNAGRIDMVDCKTLGFTGCQAGPYGCVPAP